jgi:hypothetical protein
MSMPLPIADLSPRTRGWWRVLQVAVWLIGLFIFTSLIVAPDLGLLLFWNVLIPVAPALVVVAVGLWRNICPLASIVLLPRHVGLSQRKIMPIRVQARLGLISVIALYLIVPLRHAIFNTNGPATAALISVLALVGVAMGLRYEWKSAWCSTLCPVHPVERLYGSNVIAPMPNAHCDACMNCVVPCPDSTPNMDPQKPSKFWTARLSGLLITGGLPGFVWGWFHVPDHHNLASAADIAQVYAMPMIGLALSLVVYTLLSRVRAVQEPWLTRAFAAAAVSCYYWYRIPALFGYSLIAADGVLIDARARVPFWTIETLAVASTLFFVYWLMVRAPNQKSWTVRPAYAGRRHG